MGGTSTSSLPSPVLARLAEADGSPSNLLTGATRRLSMVVSRLDGGACHMSQTRLLVTQLHLTAIFDGSFLLGYGPMPLHIFDLSTGNVHPKVAASSNN